MSDWIKRPRVLLGIIIGALVVFYLVGSSLKKPSSKSTTAPAPTAAPTTPQTPSAAQTQSRLKQLPVVNVMIGGQKFKLWLATTTAEQTAGLMHVAHLPSDRGMIFLFHHTAPKTFWMKNTPLPLDVIFLHGSTVVRMYTMKPMNSHQLYPSVQPVTAGIELCAGTCAKLGLKPGDQIHLPVSAQ